jgi:peroxiredoxin Q/BCP
MVKQGESAPDFNLRGIDENGKEREYTLNALRGRKIILYFYPKDLTPGCTTEACDFRDNFNRISKEGLSVLGVSPDSLDSHRRFREKHGLRFPLLSDPDRTVAESYGAWGEKKMYGKTTLGIIRSTFLIDEGGEIKIAWHNVKAKGHVDEVIKALLV